MLTRGPARPDAAAAGRQPALPAPAGTDPRVSWCPSGAAHAPESLVLGVRSGLDGEVTYLAEAVPAAAVLDQIPEDIEPRRILRFASHCVAGCANRRGGDCTLVERVVAAYPAPGGGAVPRCHLRAGCQWWAQAGVDGCRRCPALATRHHTDDELASLVADPDVTPEQLAAWTAARPA
ncbi:hypothetical protein [Streptomyces sp. NPDC001083]|uniref:hypothetical protein n=1 Tax=Streptomyces sp. NPDC001083 TaxID=3364545 RepID=UPI0036787DFF